MAHTNIFFQTFGFEENSYEEAHRLLNKHVAVTKDELDHRPVTTFRLDGGRELVAGTFYTPSLQQLRDEVHDHLEPDRASGASSQTNTADIDVSHIASDATSVHADISNEGAVIQAASQFNCLEMMSPRVTPEQGISLYEHDCTQGPACALACMAGPAVRNYVISVPGSEYPNGQRAGKENQINTLANIEQIARDAGVCTDTPWTFRNGYIDASSDALRAFNTALLSDPQGKAAVEAAVRIGVHRDTQVTLPQHNNDNPNKQQFVTQVYAAAVPVGYAMLCQDRAMWEPIARAVLNAAYEATLLVSVLINMRRMKRGLSERAVFLTFLGGGVFSNEMQWIVDAINDAVRRVSRLPLSRPLSVRIVHFREVKQRIVDTVTRGTGTS